MRAGSERRSSLTRRGALSTFVVLALLAVGAGVASASVPSKLTKAKAEAKAAAIVLTLGDVGAGYALGTDADAKVVFEAEVARETPECSRRDAERTLGGTKRGVGGATAFFAKGVDLVIADVGIFAKEKGAKQYMAAVGTAAYEKCVGAADSTLIERSLLPDVYTVTKTSKPIDVSVGDESFGYSCTFHLAGAASFDVDVFCIELRVGRAIATVSFPGSMPAAERDRLLKLVSTRMAGA